MSTDSFDKQATEVKGRRVIFSRATVPGAFACRFCHLDTTRAIAHKLEADPAWDMTPCCDFCFDFLQRLQHRPIEPIGETS